MPRYSKTLTPAAQAAFLAALAGGALVVAAARQAGVAISSLYCRRRRDEDFADAWEMAVDASRGAPGRRAPFDAARREDFLSRLGRGCTAAEAAAAAGADPSAVSRRIRRDPDFARAHTAALRRRFERIAIAAGRERAQAAARARTRAWDIAPTGEPTADFDEAIKLLARWDRRDGSLGRRFVRFGRMKRTWSFDDAIKPLARRLRASGHGPDEA
jgi:hypothetical protein